MTGGPDALILTTSNCRSYGRGPMRWVEHLRLFPLAWLSQLAHQLPPEGPTEEFWLAACSENQHHPANRAFKNCTRL